MIDLITTFNKKIYDEYSNNLLDTFLNNSDDDVRLNVFYEGEFENVKRNYDTFKNKIRFFEFVSQDWNIFYNKFGHLMEANGYKIVHDKVNNQIIAEGPNFRWNAVKFSFKVFSIFLASSLSEISDKIAWIDADTICINKFRENDIWQFLPNDDELMTYLGRDNFPKDFPHSETGFIGFNLLHEKFNSFIKTAISFYTTGEVFALDRYHDCLVYDTTRKIFELTGTKFRNLSGIFSSDDHPFVKCDLNRYFDHLKGNRKKIGFSPEHPNNNDFQISKENKVKLNFV